MAILLASAGLFQSDDTNSGTAECSDCSMGGNGLLTMLSSQTSARLPAFSKPKLPANPLVERFVLIPQIRRACRMQMDDSMILW